MPAGRYNLLIEQGATFERVIVWKDGNGDPVNVTGYSARLQIRAAAKGTVWLELSTTDGSIIVDAPEGAFHLKADSATTAALPAKYGVYDFEVTAPDDTVWRLLEGRVRISREVTT